MGRENYTAYGGKNKSEVMLVYNVEKGFFEKTTLYLIVIVLTKTEMKKLRLKNKLEKLKYYCYGREQYNSIIYK